MSAIQGSGLEGGLQLGFGLEESHCKNDINLLWGIVSGGQIRRFPHKLPISDTPGVTACMSYVVCIYGA